MAEYPNIKAKNRRWRRYRIVGARVHHCTQLGEFNRLIYCNMNDPLGRFHKEEISRWILIILGNVVKLDKHRALKTYQGKLIS